MLPIGLASDHAGYALKQFVKEYLTQQGLEYKDYGTYSEDSCDYPDFAHALAKGIEHGEVDRGIANVLCLPGRFISTDEAERCLTAFLNTPFEGGRHERRVEKIPVR